MKRMFYDVDTQNDFMNADGNLYVPAAEGIKGNLEKLARYATDNDIPVIGSVDRHFGTEQYKEKETELSRWGGLFPDHCMDGTYAQDKIKETDLFYDASFVDREHGGNNIFIPNAIDGSVDEEAVRKALGVVERPLGRDNQNKTGLFFEKQSFDVSDNPAFSYFLDVARPEEAVVYGVATDYCVRAAVLGLQDAGTQVYVVEDAISGVAPETTKTALEEMREAGARFVRTEEVLEDRL